MPVFLVSAGQAGATSPAALAGSLVQEIAECLAGLIYVNSVKEGAPAIFGPYCFISDLRTGAMSGGSPEQALLSAAAAQITQYYDLTCGTVSGMTDSKVPDVQSGYEKAYNHALVGNAGANLIYEAGGMMASLLGYSPEQLVIDDEIVGAVQRTDPRDRGHGRGFVDRDDPRDLSWWAGPLPGVGSDAGTDAVGIYLSDRGRPVLAQGMAGKGPAGPAEQGQGAAGGHFGKPPPPPYSDRH